MREADVSKFFQKSILNHGIPTIGVFCMGSSGPHYRNYNSMYFNLLKELNHSEKKVLKNVLLPVHNLTMSLD